MFQITAITSFAMTINGRPQKCNRLRNSCFNDQILKLNARNIKIDVVRKMGFNIANQLTQMLKKFHRHFFMQILNGSLMMINFNSESN